MANNAYYRDVYEAQMKGADEDKKGGEANE